MESMASLLSVKRPWYALNGEEQMDHQEWTLQCEDLSKEYQGGQAPDDYGEVGGGKKHPDSNDGRAAFADKGQSVV